ncbi:pentapeptide repeat-containing protein [Methanosarcina sp.]|uniref:pentapeptide repeat-containing protein n=1 Tax=Methanosarcina sp. TaxID=2213 RepID=UPI0029898B92|nr:pentapeptide repeat-containing protein [Methanosarcina sp.]MDW5551599.1 pentapeptide repeat-containing protein [Methanosarcina sp.]MDW5555905.1 pentapeptide repeat-containing protein [Methanosarcina sp.]MDW5559130.1 pentapeptide repeat-containing protein [Methanosarcina sp.]
MGEVKIRIFNKFVLFNWNCLKFNLYHVKKSADKIPKTLLLGFFSFLVFIFISMVGLADEYRDVQASEILKQIENGEDVYLENCRIVGELNLSKIKFETVPNPKYQEHLDFFYTVNKDLKVAESEISIHNSIFSNDLDFSNVLFKKSISFVEVNCSSFVNFTSTTFNNTVNFSGTAFGDSAFFHGATFNNTVNFSEATFSNSTLYYDIRLGAPGILFGDSADFSKATFGDSADFSGATFGNKADFLNATFGNNANFNGATFGDSARFGLSIYSDFLHHHHPGSLGATFGDSADFSGATFGDSADFSGATFGDSADLSGAAFGDSADFWGATFGDFASFGVSPFSAFDGFYDGGAVFGDSADFFNANFGDSADFEKSIFGNSTSFNSTTFGDSASFEYASFGDSASFKDTTFGDTVSFSATKFKSVSLNGTDFKEMKISWDSLENSLVFDGSTYVKLISNFRTLEQFEDADAAYYKYRSERQALKSWFSLSKWGDIFMCLTCGYGVRPFNTLLAGAGVVLLFSLFYWGRNGISQSTKNNEVSNQKATLSDAFYFSIITFTTFGNNDWYPKYNFRKWAMLERLLGWLTLSLFLVTLTRVMIRP